MWNIYKTNLEWYVKTQLLKQLHILVKAPKQIENEPGYCIFGFCKKIIRKLKSYFFTVIDKENALI